MKTDINNEVVGKEYYSNKVLIKLIITGGAIASMYSSSFSSNIPVYNSLREIHLSQGQILEQKSDPYRKIRYSKESNIKTLSYNDSYKILANVSDNFTTGRLLSNMPEKSWALNEHNISSDDIIYNKGIVEEESKVYQNLVTHRKNVERYGAIIGSTLGTLTLITPMFTSIDWVATAPASILFFSLPVFMLLRKKLRSESNGA